MTLPSSGALSLSQVRAEHGGNLPLSMSQLLRSSAQGSLVHSNNTAIPAAAPLDLSDFRGTSRFGFYPMTVGLINGTDGRQFGVSVPGGAGTLAYNIKFKGYEIGWFLWNEYDNIFGISLATANVPQSVVTGFGTAKTGLRTPTGYSGNFFGYSVWNVSGQMTNPFNAVGTSDSSPFIL